MEKSALSPFFLGLTFLLSGLPLIFFPQVYDVFELPKFLYLLGSFSFIVILLAWQKPVRVSLALLFPLFSLFLSFFLSSLLSADPYPSFFGTYRRHEGVVTYTLYLLLFFFALSYPLSQDQVRLLMHCLMAVTVAISFHALLQHFGYDIFGKVGQERSFSTLNHPNFLGAYLAMVILFFLYFFIRSTLLQWKILYGAGYGLSLMALLYTYSRASWLAFLAAHFLFFLFYPFASKKKIAVGLLSFFLLLFLIGSHPSLSRSSFTLYSRFFSIFDPSNPSSAARLSTWSSALKMGRDHPVFGVGLDAYKGMFPLYKKADYVQYEGLHITADKTHNEFLHFFATLGFFGFFSYLWFLFALFFSLGKKWKSYPEETGLFIAVLSAYLVQGFFSFSVITLGATFFAFAGVAMSAVPAEKKKKQKGKKSKETFFSPFLFFTGSLLFLFSLWFAWLRIEADKNYLLARINYDQGFPEEGLSFSQQSLRFPYT